MTQLTREQVAQLVAAGATDEEIIEVGRRMQADPMRQLMNDAAAMDANTPTFSDSLPQNAAMIATALLTRGRSVPTQGAVAGGAGYLGARVRGDSREDAAWAGAGQAALMGAAGMVGTGLVKAGDVITRRAVPLVRSALKPVFAEVRRRAGIEGTTPAVVANRQAKFIVDHQLRNAEQAAALARKSGQEVDEAVRAAEANPNLSPVLDTATRIPQYMSALLRRVERQMLPRTDRTAIQNVGREVVEDSPLSQYAPNTARPSPPVASINTPTFVRPSLDRPWGTPVVEPSATPRALRANIRPSEGVEIVRNRSFFDKDAKQGAIAGGKAIERAVRDSIKEAVPAARGPLATQGRAMDAERLLDRAAWRDANRDTLPGGMGPIAGLANGRPLMGWLMQAAKEGQLRAGLAAPRVGANVSWAGRAVTQADQFIRAAMLALLSQENPTVPPE